MHAKPYTVLSDRDFAKHYYAGAESVCTPPSLQHLPVRESYVSEHTASPYTEHFTFTGKERDEETGYTYHGARYYDANLMCSWFSVDPLSDKYPSMSPYNYCAWNPVKLVDPDGMKIRIITGVDEEGYEIAVDITHIDDMKGNEQMDAIREIYYSGNAGRSLVEKIMEADELFTIAPKETSIANHEVSPEGYVSWGEPLDNHGGSYINVLAEELFHCGQIIDNKWKFNEEMSLEQKLNCEVEAKEFAATFEFNRYFRNGSYFIPTQMEIMSGDNTQLKKDYLQKKVTKLPMYTSDPSIYPEACQSQKTYPHIGVYE